MAFKKPEYNVWNPQKEWEILILKFSVSYFFCKKQCGTCGIYPMSWPYFDMIREVIELLLGMWKYIIWNFQYKISSRIKKDIDRILLCLLHRKQNHAIYVLQLQRQWFGSLTTVMRILHLSFPTDHMLQSFLYRLTWIKRCADELLS